MSKFSKLAKALEHLEQKKNGVIFATDTYYDEKCIKNFIVYPDYKSIEKSMGDATNHHFYEVFRIDQRCSFIQDVDVKDEEGLENPEGRLSNVVEETTRCLREYMSLQNVKDIEVKTIIMESPKTETKASYHIVYRISDTKDCVNLLGVDSIYTKNRCLRILNSSKIQHPDNKLFLHTTSAPVDNVLETLGTYIEPQSSDKLIHNVTINRSKKKVKSNIVIQSSPSNDVVDNLLLCLKPEWAVDFHLWNKLGILLYNIYNGDKIGLEKWDKFSQKCPEKYDSKAIESRWNDSYSNLEKKMTIGSLHFYAKEDNLQMYESVTKKMYTETFFLTGSHADVAILFCNRFSDKFIYNSDYKCWFTFNKNTGIFTKEKNDFIIKKHLIQLTKEIGATKQSKSDKLTAEENEQIVDRNEKIDMFINKLKNTSYQNSVISQLEWMMNVEDTDFDNNKYIFCFSNGVYDLKTLSFRAGYYDEFITMTTGYKYKFVKSDDANEFMEAIMTDNEIRTYFLKIVSSHLADVHKREEFFVLYNKHGNNGKSTLINAIDYLFGNYFYSCKSNILMEQKYESGEAASPTICNMVNKRFISFQEIKQQCFLEGNTVKTLSGGDKINGRKLYQDNMEFRINGMLVLSCNNVPSFTKTDDKAIIRRLRCIEMSTEFVEECTLPHHRQVNNDLDIKELRHSFFQLLIEHYDPDSIKKGIQYCPRKIRETTENYFKRTDLIHNFITDYIEEDPKEMIIRKDLEALIRDKNVAREYGFSNKTVKDIIEAIKDKLNCVFLKEKMVKGVRYTNVMLGYKLIFDEPEVNICEDEL
ncbi:hypothetical protein HDV04_001627 [Boothiomyces sp. JEL0838]|nr:hypothetical protein HDV04_001627 [Boothiomyces sp. JEL0838]